MKSKPVKSLSNIFVIKTCSNGLTQEKYIPSQNKIKSLEKAYMKKIDGQNNSN
jgi:hypothetical protein